MEQTKQIDREQDKQLQPAVVIDSEFYREWALNWVKIGLRLCAPFFLPEYRNAMIKLADDLK